MAKVKCPNILCRSTDVTIVGMRTKHAINLNPLHPFTVIQEKPVGKQTFHCNKCGKVFKARI
jgi:hypothetical protein